ncbi:multiprotein-bridging factor 1 family protein [Paenarthrobacter sp. NPDC092416]|uniref:helix-turn-helix domain-containing protein n=1 Tax=Paenarthrobacter sp. NPDC092416 TaxID=3364386 RepID=UPI0037F3580E
MDELEALQTIGRLIKEERLAQGLSQVQLAKLAGTAIKTVRTLESGTRRTQEINQRKLEHALGWRAGSMSDVLKGKSTFAPDQITPDDMRTSDEPQQGPRAVSPAGTAGPVVRAAHLSDEELLAELTYRMVHRSRA